MGIVEKYLPFKKHKTYVKIANPLGKRLPLIILHGGPGSTHNSMELLIPLAEISDRPVIFYDQIGCGLSSIPNDRPELYCKETWIEELQNLIDKLKIVSFHLLGHSWGGMLAQLYYLNEKPKNVKSIILSSTLSSSKLWREETHRLIKEMSEEDQRIIYESEKNEDYSSKEFSEVLERYYKLTVADIDRNDQKTPECLLREKRRGDVAYLTAWGPSEFAPLGNLKDYETTSRLKEITAPCLICYGSKDESTEKQNKLMYENIGSNKKKLVCFHNARHMTYYEKQSEYIDVVSSFLLEND